MEIIINRGKCVKLEELENFSIALDGFVSGPKIDEENHKFSFDHHANCSRFSTLSSCEQSWTAVLLGLDPEPYKIYCNDVDLDVCCAVWCLKYPDRCKEPLVAKLVEAIGKGDRYAGAFETNGMKKVVEWVCAPEVESKRSGDYEKLSNEGLRSILEAVMSRISTYADGEAAGEITKQQYHGEYKVLRNENGWALIESNDPHALSSIWQAGFEKIAMVRPLPDSSLAVTLAKKSDFIEKFPLRLIYDGLNKLEEGWGGGSSIGGAPRNPDGSRSKLSLEDICEVIDNVILGPPKSKQDIVSSMPPRPKSNSNKEKIKQQQRPSKRPPRST